MKRFEVVISSKAGQELTRQKFDTQTTGLRFILHHQQIRAESHGVLAPISARIIDLWTNRVVWQHTCG